MIDYVVHFFIYFCIYATAGFGLTVVVGYGGFFTMAQAGFFAIGCYAYALGTTAWGLNLALCILLAIGLTSVFSLSLSFAAWRLKGDFFIMGSLAIQSLILSVLNNCYHDNRPIGSLTNLTNGPSGIAGVPRPVIFGINFDTERLVGAIAALLMVAAILYFKLVLSSPWGRTVAAMRDDELAAQGLGKNVKLLKVQVFLVSSVVAGLAGVLYAAYLGYVDPSIASLDQSVLMLSMVIVGGLGALRGAMIGAALLILLPEFLRYAHFPDQIASSLRLMAYGLLLVIMMHWRPKGILGRFTVS